MHRALTGGIVSALAAVNFAATAGGQALDLRRSGNVYSVAACPRAVRTVARCHARIVSDGAGRPIRRAGPPVAGYGPADLRDAYKIEADGDPSTVVAIVDAYGYDNAESDLAAYRSYFGLPACTAKNRCFKKLNQRGNRRHYPPQDIGWAEESALDLDMASAMCPNCQIWLVEARTGALRNLAKAVDAAARLGAHAISNSYGAADFGLSRELKQAYDRPGVAITASSGVGGPQFPASSPHVTAVGGTHLVRDGSGRGWAETAWGIGGCTRFKKPRWQIDPGCGKRTVVDAAAVADPATGVAVYGPGTDGVSTWLVFGGTSVGAPLIAGVYGANGGAVTAASTVYAHPENMFDITSGGGGGCDPAYLCMAGPGYDGPTGVGTPDGVKAFGDR